MKATITTARKENYAPKKRTTDHKMYFDDYVPFALQFTWFRGRTDHIDNI